jgi:DDE superfamily endonuclease
VSGRGLALPTGQAPPFSKKTYGLDRFWNGSHGRSEKGLEISALAWLDITANCAYALSVEQTPPTREATAPETTQIDLYLDQLTHMVSDHDLSQLRYVITDGYYSKQKFINGVQALGRHQVGKLRIDANLRYFYQGPKRLGPRRSKTYDGKVHWDDLTRFEPLETDDDHMMLYHQLDGCGIDGKPIPPMKRCTTHLNELVGTMIMSSGAIRGS